jgi:hypothetical protein
MWIFHLETTNWIIIIIEKVNDYFKIIIFQFLKVSRYYIYMIKCNNSIDNKVEYVDEIRSEYDNLKKRHK